MSTPQMLSLMNLIFSKKQRIALLTHLVGESGEFFFYLDGGVKCCESFGPFPGPERNRFCRIGFRGFFKYEGKANVVYVHLP